MDPQIVGHMHYVNYYTEGSTRPEMSADVLLSRLSCLNNDGRKCVDLERFSDTMSMVCDASDPLGYSFLALFIRECEADLTALDVTIPDRIHTSKICHRWIGRCAQLGLVELEKKGRQLQLMAKGGAECCEMREALREMERELEVVRMALQYMHIC